MIDTTINTRSACFCMYMCNCMAWVIACLLGVGKHTQCSVELKGLKISKRKTCHTYTFHNEISSSQRCWTSFLSCCCLPYINLKSQHRLISLNYLNLQLFYTICITLNIKVSRIIRKPTFCICKMSKTKVQISFAVTPVTFIFNAPVICIHASSGAIPHPSP